MGIRLIYRLSYRYRLSDGYRYIDMVRVNLNGKIVPFMDFFRTCDMSQCRHVCFLIRDREEQAPNPENEQLRDTLRSSAKTKSEDLEGRKHERSKKRFNICEFTSENKLYFVRKSTPHFVKSSGVSIQLTSSFTMSIYTQ